VTAGLALHITKAEQQIHVEAWSDSIIKVTISGPRSNGSPLTEAVLDAERPLCNVTIDRKSGTLETEGASVRWDAASGRLDFATAAGRPLTSLLRSTLSEREILKPVKFEPEKTQTSLGVDGVRVKTTDTAREHDRVSYRGGMEFASAEGEHTFGLGQHEEGHFSLRGTSQVLYQHNLKIAIPIILSSQGYAVFVNSGSAIDFSDNESSFDFTCHAVDRLEFYLVVGDTFDELTAGLQRLTGRAPMLPKQLLGYVQSKERYVDAAETVAIVEEFAERDVPLDVIVLDWRTWPEGQWGQKTLDPTRFPDPAAMVNRIHELGVGVMLSVWPTMSGGGRDQREFIDAGLMLGDGTAYDAFSPAAQDLFWTQLSGLAQFGFDYWWFDCTEPFEADWEGPALPDHLERAKLNIDYAEKFIDPAHILEYSMHHIMGVHRHHSAESDRRFGALTRSSFPGQQRYGTIAWSGDISATWEELRSQVAKGLNFVVTGQPYWTFDIGGFFAIDKPEFWFWGGIARGESDPAYAELFARWTQLGALIPVMRAHGTDLSREPWRFGAPGDEAYDAILAALHLRRSLAPYLYSAMADEARGRIFFRMLPFDFPNDPESFAMSDQFMLGPDLLCAPVLAPANGETATRRVWLPSGCDWYEFGTAVKHNGGQWIDVEARLTDLPLFVREGTILPLQDEDGLQLVVYPGRDASRELYDDDGVSMRYDSGEFSRRQLTWFDWARTLSVSSSQGTYADVTAIRGASAVDGGAVNLIHEL
jgi:alpha-D-xyloside xylohydrolase